jgi:predicted nucleotidyltransferase
VSIRSRFSKLIDAIQTTDAQVAALDTHATTIADRLRDSFDVKRILVIGSMSSERDSAIRHTSDVDLLVVLRRSETRRGGRRVSSTSVMNRIRHDLEDRYPDTDIGRDGQAVVVKFSDGSVDVVPGIYLDQEAEYDETSYPRYLIPDGEGWWMPTSPGAHNAYISDADSRSGGKLKHVAQLIKFWRWCRNPNVPLSSFHVELLLASEDLFKPGMSYAECLRNAFVLLYNRDCAALRDPLGLSGLVPAANTDAKRDAVVDAVDYASYHADRALQFQRDRKQKNAAKQWDLVFNGYFPKS